MIHNTDTWSLFMYDVRFYQLGSWTWRLFPGSESARTSFIEEDVVANRTFRSWCDISWAVKIETRWAYNQSTHNARSPKLCGKLRSTNPPPFLNSQLVRDKIIGISHTTNLAILLIIIVHQAKPNRFFNRIYYYVIRL